MFLLLQLYNCYFSRDVNILLDWHTILDLFTGTHVIALFFLSERFLFQLRNRNQRTSFHIMKVINDLVMYRNVIILGVYEIHIYLEFHSHLDL